MSKLPLRSILLVTWLVASPLTAFAQQETATITGSVKDQSGAIVPRATVTVTNIQTNISIKTESDDEGFYIIPSLRPGDTPSPPKRRDSRKSSGQVSRCRSRRLRA